MWRYSDLIKIHGFWKTFVNGYPGMDLGITNVGGGELA